MRIFNSLIMYIKWDIFEEFSNTVHTSQLEKHNHNYYLNNYQMQIELLSNDKTIWKAIFFLSVSLGNCESVKGRCSTISGWQFTAVKIVQSCSSTEVGDKSTSLVFFCAARNHMPAVCSLLNDLTKLILGMVPKKNLRNK